MLRGRRYKLNLYHDTGERQLFDLEQDPEELHDLAEDPACRGEAARLMERYLDEKAAEDYRQNASRGGMSAIPAWSKAARRMKEEASR